MAGYATLVSLFNNLDQIQNHPRFSNSLDKYQIESLGIHINFLLDFVESYNINGDLSKGAEELRKQIVCAAHEAEDIIESHIVNQILPGSAEISDIRLHHRCLFGLQKVIQEMNSIKDKVLKFKEEKPTTNSTSTASSTPTPLSSEQNTMVGFDDKLMQLKDMVIAQQPSRQIISIVGMGGSGKTTLAKHFYQDTLTMHHFDLRAWATISQDYDVRDILVQLLSVAEGTLDDLGERLHQKLFGRRYLIVLDDMWDMEVWNRLKFFFPDNDDGSRIILTTRLLNIATQLCSIYFMINFLDELSSWNLFCQKIFGHQYCPIEQERIGKEIVKQCKGLPLSIVVIGGILKKSPRTKEYWHNVAQNMNAIFNSTENGQILDVLYLSYSHLPAHLKPCFLYLGTLGEDSEIRVSEIIDLWIALGILKPNGVQFLEEMAEDYLKDLLDRNLILVCKHRLNGKIRSFRIHDLLRELCLRVAHKEEFFCVVRANRISQVIDRNCHLIFYDRGFQSTSLALSLICHEPMEPVNCRLLRVSNPVVIYPAPEVFQNPYVNQLSSSTLCRSVVCRLPKLSSSISLIWNLQTLVIHTIHQVIAPLDIWKMTQLRHLKCTKISLPDPPPSDDKDDSVVFRNLQTLSHVYNFILSEEVWKRIPNIRKLRMTHAFNCRCDSSYYDNLLNLGHLQRLESVCLDVFSIEFSISKLKDAFPGSLNKLIFERQIPNSEEMSMIVGSLPQLVVLKLRDGYSSQFQKWSCVEGGFFRLKYLSIDRCALKSWALDGASCFPVLEKLVLVNLSDLDEIPSGIGEIPTLQLIRLEDCKESLVISALKVKEGQESFGNNDLRIQVKMGLLFKEKLRERVEAEGLSIKDIHFV